MYTVKNTVHQHVQKRQSGEPTFSETLPFLASLQFTAYFISKKKILSRKPVFVIQTIFFHRQKVSFTET